MTRANTFPESDTVGASTERGQAKPRRIWANVFRAFATKLFVLIVIFVTVPIIVYDQLLAADGDNKLLLMDSARQQGRMVAEILRPRLGQVTPEMVAELTAALGSLDGAAVKVKLLYRPSNAAKPDGFFYVASIPPVTTEYLERERTDLIERGVLAKVRATCATADPIAERYVNPSGREEVLTSLTPIDTAAGCWVVITSHASADFLSSSIGRPYWMTPEILGASTIYLLMALFATLLYLDAWHSVRTFRGLAHGIRTGRRGETSFADFNRVPELAGAAREFDRLIEKLHNSADQMRYAAEENAHAFKTPIAVIAQSLEPLKRGAAADAGVGRAVDRIERSVERLDALVTAARQMEEMTAELLDQPLQRVELLEPMKRIVQAYGVAQGDAGPDIVLTASATPAVNAGEDLLETVIENLLDNAISFSPPGGEVTLALDAEGSDALITVDDEGPGVAEEKLEQIFERYYSERDETAELGSGDGHEHFGIGLWIVRRNVESIGGRITAENRPRGGLRLRLRIPAV